MALHPTSLSTPNHPTFTPPQPDFTVKPRESETYDIYLVPPGEDPETCQSWLRMRYRDGRYNLMFEEWVVEVRCRGGVLWCAWLAGWVAGEMVCPIPKRRPAPRRRRSTWLPPRLTAKRCAVLPCRQGHFIISPRVTFEVPVRILGGLMALGYEIGSIMRRTSEVYSDSE